MQSDKSRSTHLLDALSTAVIVTDLACRVSYMNQAAEQILQISSKRAKGKQLQRIVDISEIDRKTIDDAIREGRPITKRESHIVTKNRVPLTVDFTVSPMRGDENEQVVIEFAEMDRLIRINREGTQSSAFDTSRQLARGMAHEVKNPLGGIRGAAQLLHHELKDPSLREYTEVITKEADRLRNLVDQMLGPNSPPKIKRMNIHEVLERVILLLNAESGGRMIILKDYDPSLPDVLGDLEQLIQAVLNVCHNAMQVMLESEINEPTLRLRTRAQHRTTINGLSRPTVVRVDICDNGPGIPATLRDEIFFPMISGRESGTGLGLPIAQSIIKHHDGSIEFESAPGCTEFCIYLPIDTSKDQE